MGIESWIEGGTERGCMIVQNRYMARTRGEVIHQSLLGLGFDFVPAR
jgi:hypothetical protein